VIRFSAGLVAVAIGVLIGGVATSKLLLVYVAIGLSAAALVALAIGVVLKREELFGEQRTSAPAAAGASDSAPVLVGTTSSQPNGAVDPPAPSVPPVASAAFGEAAARGAEGAEGSVGDRAGRPSFDSPLDEPGYAQAAHGRDAYAPPPSREGLAAGDWSARDAASRKSQQATPASPASPASPAYEAGRQPQSPFEAPRPDTPAAAARGTETPWREKPSPSYGKSPSHGDSASPDYPWTASASAAPTAPAPATGRSEVPPPPAASAPSAAPASSAPDRPSWFERSARPERDTTDDKPAPESAAESAGTGEDAPAAAADDPAAASPEDSAPGEAAPGEAAPAKTAALTPPGTDLDTGAAEAAAEREPAATAPAPAAKADADAAPGEPSAKQESSSAQVTVVPGVPRYHEKNCILIRFMTDDDLQQMTVAQATEAGCTPCRACHHD
jgi:hypothetical protein